MKEVTQNYIIPKLKENQMLNIEIHYACFFAPNQCFYPMQVSTSAYSDDTLEKIINEGATRYLEDGYLKVEARKVLIGKIEDC